eukprot:3187410-Rhodomonas_salina.1
MLPDSRGRPAARNTQEQEPKEDRKRFCLGGQPGSDGDALAGRAADVPFLDKLLGGEQAPEVPLEQPRDLLLHPPLRLPLLPLQLRHLLPARARAMSG